MVSELRGLNHFKTADCCGWGFEERHISVVVELKFCNDEHGTAGTVNHENVAGYKGGGLLCKSVRM